MDQAPSYYLDTTKRHLLTPNNLEELDITKESLLESIQNNPSLKDPTNGFPVAFSINETVLGDFPEQTAADRGWMAYMNIGAPLIEERSDITQPAPDVLSTRAYTNRDKIPRRFEDTVEFSISNTISWSLEGTAQLTFGARTSAQLEQQLQMSSQKKNSLTNTTLNSKDRQGSDQQSSAETTITGTAIGAARGTSELFAQLMLGITASISGSLTTSWTSRSSISGDLTPATSVETVAAQRRQVKQYNYELPITFSGYVALYYPEGTTLASSIPLEPGGTPTVIARSIDELQLYTNNQYRPKGIAETVSALDVEHTAFDSEALSPSSQEALTTPRPHRF